MSFSLPSRSFWLNFFHWISPRLGPLNLIFFRVDVSMDAWLPFPETPAGMLSEFGMIGLAKKNGWVLPRAACIEGRALRNLLRTGFLMLLVFKVGWWTFACWARHMRFHLQYLCRLLRWSPGLFGTCITIDLKARWRFFVYAVKSHYFGSLKASFATAQSTRRMEWSFVGSEMIVSRSGPYLINFPFFCSVILRNQKREMFWNLKDKSWVLFCVIIGLRNTFWTPLIVRFCWRKDLWFLYASLEC